jgi:hypothetical protein
MSGIGTPAAAGPVTTKRYRSDVFDLLEIIVNQKHRSLA